MIKLVDATNRLLKEYLENARSIDLEEVEVASGAPLSYHLPTLPLDQVKVLVDANTEEVLGIAGIGETRGDLAVIWLLLTNAVEGRKTEFLRFSKRFLKDTLFKQYRYFTNAVYKCNELHVAWLNWLGARWIYIDDNDQFQIFLLERKE